MDDMVTFIPRAELDAKSNLAELIALARLTPIYGPAVVFDDPIWDITARVSLVGHGAKRFRIRWEKLGQKGRPSDMPLDDSYVDFAKAHIVYCQARRAVESQDRRLAAHRTVEAALIQLTGTADPLDINHRVLETAASIAKKQFGAKVAYQVGGKLEDLAKFLRGHRLTRHAMPPWVNPIERPSEPLSRVGDEFNKRRAALLPSDGMVEALARAFSLAKTPLERAVAAMTAILLAAPERFSEQLRLPVDCEIEVPNGKGGRAYGLRWWPSKGAEPRIKLFTATMVPIVREAVSHLRELGAPAREMARWYEEHPSAIYLTAELEHLRGREYLTSSEVADIVGVTSQTNARTWCARRAVQVVADAAALSRHGLLARAGHAWGVRFADLERAVLRLLPRKFPFMELKTQLRYSEGLLVFPRHMFRRGTLPSPCLFEEMTLQRINDGLGARRSHGLRSIFDDLGLNDEKGNPVRFTSMKFRHFLNTVAQAGGMSDIQIAEWSGRKDVRQNRAYDHVTAEERLDQLREYDPASAVPDSELQVPETPAPISRAWLSTARQQGFNGHVTDFGMCLHDFSVSPCTNFLACLDCTEHECVKTDGERGRFLKERLQLDEELLIDAMSAEEDGLFGANRWTQSYSKSVERLRQLVAIYEDPTIPYGSRFRLADASQRIGGTVQPSIIR